MARLLLLVLIVFMVLTALAFKYLGWLGLPVMLVALIGAGMIIKRMLAKAFMKMLTAPFAAKGAVLKDAEARVHQVAPAAAPSRVIDAVATGDGIGDRDAGGYDEDLDDEGGDDDAYYDDLSWYHIDATITPRAAEGPMHFWEPGELRLAPPGSVSGDTDVEDSDGGCAIHTLEIWHDGEWRADDGEKFNGPLRIRLLAGVKPDMRSAHFRYYFEVFGTITIPNALDGELKLSTP